MSEDILKNLGLRLIVLNQPTNLYLKRNKGCVLNLVNFRLTNNNSEQNFEVSRIRAKLMHLYCFKSMCINI